MISVIVPIYQVADYLQQCLDSLMLQTKADVEFLLIDDGSTDMSGQIAEDYARQDARVRVFHTDNHGLSAARNLGIEHARGEWLMFVDSDDWVEPDFCKKPYDAAVERDADLVIFQRKIIRGGREVTPKKRCSDGSQISEVDDETALKVSGPFAWNKLYRRELFEEIRYPDGRVFEDLAITHKLIFAAKRIVVLPDALYCYRDRKDSLSHLVSAEKKRDGLLSALSFTENLIAHGIAEDVYYPGLILRAITFLATAEPSSDQIYHQAEELIDAVKTIPSTLPFKHKVMIVLWKTCKPLFHLVCKLCGQRNRT